MSFRTDRSQSFDHLFRMLVYVALLLIISFGGYQSSIASTNTPIDQEDPPPTQPYTPLTAEEEAQIPVNEHLSVDLPEPASNEALQGNAPVASQVDCALDVMMVFDGSGSIGDNEFSTMKSFAVQLVDSFDIGADATQVGFVQFSDSARLESRLVADANLIRRSINGMVQIGGSTDIATGIVLGQSELSGSREAGRNIMIVLTDGQHNGSGDPVVEAANARSAGTEIFGIAVGSGADRQLIEDISDGNAFDAASFEQLEKVLNDLVAESCALVVEEVEFDEWSVDNTWRSLSGQRDGNNQTHDGNLVRITATIRNISSDFKQADVRFVDNETGNLSLLPDLSPNDCVLSQNFPPQQETIVTCIWDTSWYSWYQNGAARAEVPVIIEVADGQTGELIDSTFDDQAIIKVRPRPVVYVRGLGAEDNSVNFQRYAAHTQQARGTLNDWTIQESENVDLGTSVLGSLTTGLTIGANAQALDGDTEQIRQDTGAWQVDMVAHSTGSLVVRQYLHEYMPDNTPSSNPFEAYLRQQPTVINAALLGGPHAGSFWADNITFSPAVLTNSLVNGFGTLWWTRSDWVDGTIFSRTGSFNDRIFDRNGADIVLVSVDPDGVVTDFSGLGQRGWVLTENIPALNGSYRYLVDCGAVISIDRENLVRKCHSGTLLNYPTFQNNVLPHLRGDFLRNGGSGTQSQFIQDAPQPLDATPESLDADKFLAGDEVQVAAGADQAVTVNVPASTRFGIAFNVPDGTGYTLTDPTGTITQDWTPAAGEGFPESIIIESPLAGAWTLTLQNPTGAAVDVSYGAWVTGYPVDLDIEPTVGADNVQIKATFAFNGNPLANATVEAQVISAADGSETTVTLADNGSSGDDGANDGVYGGTAGGLAPGEYFIIATADLNGFQYTDSVLAVITQVDLAVDITAPGSIVATDDMTYTVTVTNNGPTYTDGINLTTTLPAGVTLLSAEGCSQSGETLTCDLGALSNGGSVPVVVDVFVTPGAAGTLTGTASITGSASDTDSGNNSASVDTTVIAPVANNSFGNATLVDTLPYSSSFDISNATGTANDPVLGCGWVVDHTVWYEFTPAGDAPIGFSTAGSNFDTVMAVYESDGAGNLTRLACVDDETNQTGTIELSLTAGTTYYALVGGDNGASGNLQFSMAEAPGPINDDFVNAINIATLPFADERSTIAATVEATDPTPSCDPDFDHTVWYSYTATTQAVEFDTSGSSFDTVLSVWEQTETGFVEVFCDDDRGVGSAARIRMQTTPGTTYYIMGSGFEGDSGDFLLNASDITDAIPPNDTVDGAINIPGLSFANEQDTELATVDMGEPMLDCMVDTGPTVWYTYSPGFDGTTRFTTEGSSYDTLLGVYTVVGGNFNQLACNDDNGPDVSSFADIETQAGTTYFVMVGGDNNDRGVLQFRAVDITRYLLPNDNFGNATVIEQLPFADSADTTFATSAADDPTSDTCEINPDGATVWYELTPTSDFTAVMSTRESRYSTTIAVYTGSRGNLTEVGCNTADSTFAGAELSLPVTANQTYYILVAPSSSFTTSGELVFTITGQGQTYSTVAPIAPLQNDIYENSFVEFIWLANDDATWYQLSFVSPSGVPASEWYEADRVCDDNGICSEGFSLDNGRYQWSVRAFGAAGLGEWSDTIGFNVGPTPGLIRRVSPLDGVTVTDTTYNDSVQWQADEDANWYRVYLTGPDGYLFDDWFQAEEACDGDICTAENLIMTNGDYTWWMAGFGDGGVGQYDSTEFRIDLPAPGAITQLTPTVDLDVTFQWLQEENSLWYGVTLIGDALEGQTDWYRGSDVCDDGVCTLVENLPDGDYTWRIVGWGPGQLGEASERDFSVNTSQVPPPGPIAQLTPTNSALTEFRWRASSAATWYRVFLSGPNGFTFDEWFPGDEVCSRGICSVSSPALNNGEYNWWMAGWGPGGQGTYSNRTFVIDVGVPGNINRIFPTESVSTVDGEVTLVWEKAPEASWYRVALAGPGSFFFDEWLPGVEYCSGDSCSLTLTLENGSYEWSMAGWGPAGAGELDQTEFRVTD